MHFILRHKSEKARLTNQPGFFMLVLSYFINPKPKLRYGLSTGRKEKAFVSPEYLARYDERKYFSLV